MAPTGPGRENHWKQGRSLVREAEEKDLAAREWKGRGGEGRLYGEREGRRRGQFGG